jgi:hypothetical protein
MAQEDEEVATGRGGAARDCDGKMRQVLLKGISQDLDEVRRNYERYS